MGIEYLVIYFTAYSFIGWSCEIFYCSIFSKKLVLNRGILYGPICPIYGFGALIVIFTLKDLLSRPILLFFASIFLTSSLEYATSFILEYIFDTLWWDYSKYKLNINGRICALNSFLFGVLSILLMYIINPFISKYIELIPASIAAIIGKTLLFLFLLNLILTLKTLINLHDSLLRIKLATENLYRQLEGFNISDRISEGNIAESLNALKEKLKQNRAEFFEKMQLQFKNISQHHLNTQRLISAFPNMRQRKNNLHLKLLKYFREKHK